YDGYVVDVTEKKRLEEALAQTQKLESVGMLAGGIAHDFSNIITGILGYAALIKLGGQSQRALFEYAEKIEQSASRAATLTRQLLGFARKGKFKVEAVDANALAGELVGFLRETFDRSIDIATDTEAGLPAVRGDSTQLYQALLNLCINARDAMPEGGLLTLRTEFWDLETEEVLDCFRIAPGPYVRISVSDTGVGMPPEVKKRVFEPFFTTKEVGKGTGLGLSMVYGIAKNHGGYVDVQSEPGAGTTVRLYLPVTEEQPVAGGGEDRSVSSPRTGAVLFVDDETVLRQLVRNTLERHSYRVFLAEDGVEGIKIFGEQKEVLDLVILDMNMPKKNGRQVFEEIRAVKPDAKILLCSGYGPEEQFEELFRMGAAGFVQKPFRAEDLLREVENVLRVAA
ncbi:MAG: response regulator, partial [Deltaproteobacteria bacterium]|nr:response regulator [Deltaproteobacteria bacterium]